MTKLNIVIQIVIPRKSRNNVKQAGVWGYVAVDKLFNTI